MADFFSAVGDVDAAGNLPDNTKLFADAIAARFNAQTDDSVLTARLLPPVLPLSLPREAEFDGQYTAVPPDALGPWLDDLKTLVVDIRPHAAYSSARIGRAVSLSVPSTLLKRPAFSLQRLSAMLPSASARTRFSAWRTAPRILVYDADSTTLSDTCNIQGLLRKFRADSPSVALAWVRGGFQAVWQVRRDLIDVVPPTPETETEDDPDDDDAATASPAAGPSRPTAVLRAHHLPRAAFALASTTQAPRRPGPPLLNPSQYPNPHHNMGAAHDTAAAGKDSSTAAYNPFFDAVRQNTELSHGITERIPLRLPKRVRRRVQELPFPWLRNIARRAAPATPPDAADAAASRPDSSEDENESSDSAQSGTEALAMQFYRIELAEQRRMMGVMEHHSRESATKSHDGVGGHGFPFSITAGVEKGSKNRYRNIWPFEHARVRLHRLLDAPAPSSARAATEYDNYINASHVQPLGTRRRYIATQGPLEATFGDFWTLVWQQNVHVVVMLTREVEGAMIKCGAYWRPGTYGPLRVELLGCAAEGCTGVCALCSDEAGAEPGGGGFFAPAMGTTSAQPRTPPGQLIKRTLRLTHAAYPEAPPRRIAQLHYLGWPDMNVPDDARGVLGLVWELGRVVEELGKGRKDGGGTMEAEKEDAESSDGNGSDSEVDGATGVLRRALRAGDARAPVLLHCSAGVGRTGGFIAVDAVLDAVRQEAREMYAAGASPSAGSGGGSVARSGSEGVSHISAGMRASEISGGGEEDRMEIDVEDVDADVDMETREYAGYGMRTPMQVDSAEATQLGETTRRWAQRVADTDLLSAFAPRSLPQTAFPSLTASETGLGPASLPTSTLGSPFQFQSAATHRTTFSLSLPRAGGHAHDSLPSTPATNPHSPNPESKSASLPLKMPAAGPGGGALPLAVRRGNADRKILSDRPLANSPLPDPDRPRSLSPFSAMATSRRSMHSFEGDGPTVPTPEEAPHVDYKEPRVLHGRSGARPVRLSAFEDPIWEVVQDMREQRMSLCQSFRQYVFVHAAIIEGALMVADEERARAGVTWRPTVYMPSPRRGGGGLGIGARATRPTRLFVPSDDAKSAASSTGKRLASPTELPKEDKKGEIALSKRPSIKRKLASGDEYVNPIMTFPPP
ncbi:hypothetical protein C8R45DRAFT_809267 [Mycena sanguinolenta]|nr:hypothetical protein C8R45DRAFT_809267 [Mycena sanguinolenta]